MSPTTEPWLERNHQDIDLWDIIFPLVFLTLLTPHSIPTPFTLFHHLRYTSPPSVCIVCLPFLIIFPCTCFLCTFGFIERKVRERLGRFYIGCRDCSCLIRSPPLDLPSPLLSFPRYLVRCGGFFPPSFPYSVFVCTRNPLLARRNTCV